MYWNTAILIHLCTIYSCLCDTTANLRAVTETIWPTKPKTFSIWDTAESLLIPAHKMPEDFSNILMKWFFKKWVIINKHYYISFKYTNIKLIKWHFEELSTLSKLLFSYVIWGNSHTSVSSPVKWVWCGCKAQYKI